MQFSSTKTAGYSLVEVLVAITVLLLSIVGPMTIAAKGIQTGRFVGEQTTATYLAQEGIESVLAYRNQFSLEQYSLDNYDKADHWDWVGTNASKFLGDCFVPSGNIESSRGCNLEWLGSSLEVTKCTGNPVNGSCRLHYQDNVAERSRFTTVTDGDDSPYVREIKLIARGPGEVEVISSVSWEANLFGERRSVELRTSIFNIYALE